MSAIPFIDLQAQRRRLGTSLTKAIESAVEGGQWIMGPQVRALEEQLAEFAGVKHAIACANGTDALMIVLRAWNIGPGDAEFVPAFTFAASAEVVALIGATPVFVDVCEDTFNICSKSLEAAITMVKREGKLRPRVVMPVDLFGQPADYDAIEPIVAREKLLMLCDAAQGFGALLGKRRAGGIGDAAATSFFPAKPLGCFGDGGASFTNDDGLDELLRSIRIHGQGADKYENVRIGVNSRLDTIQAAILIEKLKIFPEEIEMREKVAQRYSAALGRSNRIRGIPSFHHHAVVRLGRAHCIIHPVAAGERGRRVPLDFQLPGRAHGVPLVFSHHADKIALAEHSRARNIADRRFVQRHHLRTRSIRALSTRTNHAPM